MFEDGERGQAVDRCVAREALGRAAELLVDLDWAELDGAELADTVASLGRVWRVVEAAVAHGMAAMSRPGVADAALGMPATSWWVHRRLGHGGQGAWLVRAGELIDRFPVLGAAVRRGELHLEHLRVIEEIRDESVLAELVELDGELCRIAERASLVAWRREVRRRVEIIRAEHARPAPTDDAAPTEDDPGSGEPSGRDRPPPSNSPHEGWLSLRTTAEGALLLRGELTGHAAEVVRQLMAGELSRQRRAAWREHDSLGVRMPGVGELRVRALVRLLRDAPAGGGAATSPARTEAVVVIEADDHLGERVRSLDGEPISAELAALLHCDAYLQALIVDQRGQPLWLGRSTRLASAAQRRALTVRDGGCVFPGCDMPPEWCDAHHEPGWTGGGRTDPEHLVLLCRRHHGAAHSRDWQLRPVGGQRLPHRAGAGGSQRFEWVDLRTGTTTAAQQRALRSPPLTPDPVGLRDSTERRCA